MALRGGGQLWPLLLLAAAGLAAGGGDEAVTASARVTHLWPILLTQTSLSGGGGKSLETPEWGRKLSEIGYQRYKHYVSKVLPRELELDPVFNESYHQMDHSRVQLAFKRWQTRAFATDRSLPIRRLLPQAERSPRLDGIDYSWPELYDSVEFKRLIARIRQLSKLYLKRAGYESKDIGKKFLVFPWVEVFRQGDALRPMTRSDGAYLFGRYFSAVTRGSLKFNFEDPRGINPPYGKTYSDSVYPGEIALVPSWLSTFITPNMMNTTAVCYCFLVYPENGRLQWDQDMTGGITLNKAFSVNARS